MIRNTIVKLLTALFFLASAGSWKDASAIPSFARKYQISCQVCHSPAIPRLKAFGDEFAGNGFRLTEYESPRYLIETGDDRLSLLRELPLSIRMDGFVSYNFNNKNSADFGSPYVLKIMSGGELSDKLSYYFYFLFNERGSIAGVEDAFLMYHDLFGSGINFYIGQFQTSDPLFKGELRFTLEPYKIYGAAPGTSTTDMQYDRGIVVEKDIFEGTTLVGQIVNGCGIGEAGEGYLFDKDKYKNYMGKITQAFGKYVTAGFFGYSGKEEITSILTGPFTSKILIYGPDISLDLNEKVIVNFQYMRRTDSEVLIPLSSSIPSLTETDVLTTGGFGEIIISPKGDLSKWYLTGLYNWVDYERDDHGFDYQAATFHAGYILRRNLRIVAEYTQQFSFPSHGRINAGFISAF